MKILYLTTSLLPEDYAYALQAGFPVENPSNQNFHSRLIKVLMEKAEVDVLSLVPSKGKKLTFLSSNNYHYFNRETPIFFQNATEKKLINFAKGILNNKDSIVVFDSLNIHLARVSSILQKKCKTKTIAVLTDNPKNLAKTPWIYQKAFKHYVFLPDAYFSLSEGLFQALISKPKPHLVFEGVVEEEKVLPPLYPEGRYLYFGGALQSRYGAETLLRAYLATPMDYDFYLAGHHPEDSLKKLLIGQSRIHFLGQVSKEENTALEEHAALVVNPRPFDPVLDQQSVPSKMLEYLMSETPILSVRHTRLQELFPNDVNWLKEGNEEELINFFKNHLDEQGHFKDLCPNHAKEKALALYGTKALGARLYDFLTSLN